MKKPIKGYEGRYEIDEDGNVHSLPRQSGSAKRKGRILKATIGRDGYYKVCLLSCYKQKTAAIHRLVAEAFIPNPQGLPMVNHKDTNKLNNRVDNLEWVTRQQNVDHAVKSGRIKKGFGHSSYIGVYKARYGWKVELQKDGVTHYLGHRKTEKEAAILYNEHASLYGRDLNIIN